MKKITVFLITIMSVFVFVACNNTTTETTASTTSTSTTDTQTTTFKTDESVVNYEGSYCDDLVVDQNYINNLLSNMTLEEKVGQMLEAERAGATPTEAAQYNLGSILSGGGSSPSTNEAYYWYLMYKDYQDKMRTNSTSQIPIVYGIDAVHGDNNVYGATIFPQNIGLGAANDPELMERIGTVVAREVRVTGINYTFAPAVSIVQDISWGRTYESFSESSDIVENLVGSYISGLQNYCVAASAKHYVADGGTDGGTDQGNASLTEQEIRDLHLKPYYDAIEAGVYTIMISYSSISGQKMHGSHYWITDVLKDEMGFDGFVISDYEAIHQLSGTYYDQIVASVNAGVDMLMEPYSWKEAISNILLAVDRGDISETRINDAVRRILTIKYKMGLFSDDFYDENTGDYYRLTYDEGFATNENKAVAREAVRESLVLLKNDNNALPLSKTETVAVIGEGADNIGLQCGGWTISWQGSADARLTKGTTIIQGMKKAVAYTSGTVVEDVSSADTVVIVFSENPYAEGAGDNDNLTLTGKTAHEGNQDLLDLAIAAKNQGKTVIAVIVAGRPLVIGDNLNYFDALVMAWLPGTEGAGVADVLYGDYDFSGKLPVTWPKTLQGIGMNMNRNDYNSAVVLYPFGYGLSYKEESTN